MRSVDARIPAWKAGFEPPDFLTLVGSGYADEWEPGYLPPEAELAVESAEAHDAVWTGLVGRASTKLLRDERWNRAEWALTNFDPSRGSFDVFLRLVLATVAPTYRERYTRRDQRREFVDDVARDNASDDDAALVSYVDYWDRRLFSLQRAFPGRWKVPEQTDEELREELTLQLIKGIRDNSIGAYERPGTEATYRFLANKRDQLRVVRKIYEVPKTRLAQVVPRVPTPEELFAVEQTKHRRSEDLPGMLAKLSKPQQRYVWALRLELNAEKEGDHRPADVARRLRRNRSSATRALRAVRNRLEELGARELYVDPID